MSKKPKKRYSTREAIIRDIDKYTDDIWFCTRHVGVMQERINEFHHWQAKNPEPKPATDFWRGQFHERRSAMERAKESIDKHNRRSARNSLQLEKLKEKLATMDTLTMPFLTDSSVV